MNDKQTTKIREELSELRKKNGKGHCWVCGAKTSGVRCKKCIDLGGTTWDAMRYEELKRRLGGRLGRQYKADKKIFLDGFEQLDKMGIRYRQTPRATGIAASPDHHLYPKI